MMQISLAEVRDLEKFLGTLSSCDYLGVAPRLKEEDVFLLEAMHAKMAVFLREHGITDVAS